MSGSRRSDRLLPDDFMKQLDVRFNRRGKVSTPFPPGTRVISDFWIADDLQHEVEPGGPNSSSTVTDYFHGFVEPLFLQARLDLVEILERRVGFEESVPWHADCRGNMAGSGNSHHLLAGIFFETPGIGDEALRMRALDQ